MAVPSYRLRPSSDSREDRRGDSRNADSPNLRGALEPWVADQFSRGTLRLGQPNCRHIPNQLEVEAILTRCSEVGYWLDPKPAKNDARELFTTLLPCLRP